MEISYGWDKPQACWQFVEVSLSSVCHVVDVCQACYSHLSFSSQSCDRQPMACGGLLLPYGCWYLSVYLVPVPWLDKNFALVWEWLGCQPIYACHLHWQADTQLPSSVSSRLASRHTHRNGTLLLRNKRRGHDTEEGHFCSWHYSC